jgi:hypothetical protein
MPPSPNGSEGRSATDPPCRGLLTGSGPPQVGRHTSGLETGRGRPSFLDRARSCSRPDSKPGTTRSGRGTPSARNTGVPSDALREGLARALGAPAGGLPGCTSTCSSGVGGNLPRTVPCRRRWHLIPGASWSCIVRWAIDSEGLRGVWHRLKGVGSWKKAVSVRGYPTDSGRKGVAGHADGVTSDKAGPTEGRRISR